MPEPRYIAIFQCESQNIDRVAKAVEQATKQIEEWLNNPGGERVLSIVVPFGVKLQISRVGEGGLEELQEIKVTYEREPKAPYR